jgi:hypothetical protein
MSNFFKKNYIGFEQIILFLFVSSFFFPTIDFSYRLDHLSAYLLAIYSFIIALIFLIKKKNDSIKNIIFENKILFFFFAFYSLFIFFVIISLFKALFFSENIDIIFNEGHSSIIVILANLDNYLEAYAIIIVGMFFFLSKEREKNFDVFLLSIVLIFTINAIYGLFELYVYLLDRNCTIYLNPEQSSFCSFISFIDRSFSGVEFSNAYVDYNSRAIGDDGAETITNSTPLLMNSTSIGWLALSAGRSSGILNMPIQGGTGAGIAIFLLFILYFRDKESLFREKLNNKFFVTIFFILLIGVIIPISRITSHITIPGLLIYLIIANNNFKEIASKNYSKFCLILFLMILIVLGTLRWNGFNGYYTHVLRYAQIYCHIASLKCNFPEQILRERTRVDGNSYAIAKNIINDSQLLIIPKNISAQKEKKEIALYKKKDGSRTLTDSNIAEIDLKIKKIKKELQKILEVIETIPKEKLIDLYKEIRKYEVMFGVEDNNIDNTVENIVINRELIKLKITNLILIEKKIGQEFVVNKRSLEIKKYIFHLTGGRFGGETTVPIKYVLKEKKYFGYGPITNHGFDQLYTFLFYHTGLIALVFYMLIITTIFFQIIKNREIFKNQKIMTPIIIGNLIFFLASFGAPIYFINRINFIFFFLVIYILSEVDIKRIKNEPHNIKK